MKSGKIFINYAREDWNVAKKLYDDLHEIGLSPWMDTEDLLPGQNWKAIIHDVISNCAVFVALISSGSISKRGYIQKELQLAFSVLDEFPPDSIFLIPILIDDCKPIDERLKNLHWIHLHDSYDDGFHKLVNAIVPDEYQNLVPAINFTLNYKSKPSRSVQRIIVQAEDRTGLMRELALAFVEYNLALTKVRVDVRENNSAEFIFDVEIPNDIIEAISLIKGVSSVSNFGFE